MFALAKAAALQDQSIHPSTHPSILSHPPPASHDLLNARDAWYTTELSCICQEGSHLYEEKNTFTPTIVSLRCCRRLLQSPVSVTFLFCCLLDLLQIRRRAETSGELSWEHLLLVWALATPLHLTSYSAVGTGQVLGLWPTQPKA